MHRDGGINFASRRSFLSLQVSSSPVDGPGVPRDGLSGEAGDGDSGRLALRHCELLFLFGSSGGKGREREKKKKEVKESRAFDSAIVLFLSSIGSLLFFFFFLFFQLCFSG